MSDEAGQTPQTEESVETVEGNTNDSINSSLDEVEDTETLKRMVKALRNENKQHRLKNNALKDQYEEYEAWKESQKTEIQKAIERAEAAEKRAFLLEAKNIAKEFGLDDEDDLEFILDSDPKEMLRKAEKLSGKRQQNANDPADLSAAMRPQGVPSTGLLAGAARGGHVGSETNKSKNDEAAWFSSWYDSASQRRR